LASQVILPKLTYEMQVGRIFEWLCSEGQKVSTGQPLFVVETDKATDEIPSDENGFLLKILIPAGIEIPVGTTVAWIGQSGEAVPENGRLAQNMLGSDDQPKPNELSSQKISATSSEIESGSNIQEEIIISPLAKRLARELDVDLKQLAKQIGKMKIREADIKAYAESRKESQDQPVQSFKDNFSKLIIDQDDSNSRDFTIVQPTPLQNAMKIHMTQSAVIPQMAAGCELNLTSLEQFRESHQSNWEKKYSFRLSYTHLLAALVVQVVKIHPIMNASWTDQGIMLYRRVSLGIAMATERGLVVPVVRKADELSLEKLAIEIVRLQQAAKTNRLSSQDLEGGTFTLTNVGMFGIELSIPLLYPPQSAILGTGAKKPKLVLENGLVKSIPVMAVTIVCDHRIVDGAAQGSFLQTLKKYIEDPTPILSLSE
jgi:pyruvate dehydrogenase E2 component (dihydrolipoamide acetyltransferase)